MECIDNETIIKKAKKEYKTLARQQDFTNQDTLRMLKLVKILDTYQKTGVLENNHGVHIKNKDNVCHTVLRTRNPKLKVCNRCESQDIYTNESNGTVTCENCGIVLSTIISTESECNNYPSENGNQTKDQQRVAPVDPYFPNSGSTTITGTNYEFRKLTKLMNRSSSFCHKDRSRWLVFKLIEKACENSKLGSVIYNQAKSLYNKVATTKKICNNKIEIGNNLCLKHIISRDRKFRDYNYYESFKSNINQVCGVEGLCRNYRFKDFLCEEHYNHKDKDTIPTNIEKKYCTVKTHCNNSVSIDGLCNDHYNRKVEEHKIIKKVNKVFSKPSYNEKCQMMDFNLFRRGVRMGIIAACLYYACKIQDTSRTSGDIASYFNINVQDVDRGCNSLLSILPELVEIESQSIDADSMISKYCSAFRIDYKYISTIQHIYKNAHLLGCDKSHKPESVAAGSMWYYFYTLKFRITKHDVSQVTGVSQVTIEKVYQSFKKVEQLLLYDISL